MKLVLKSILSSSLGTCPEEGLCRALDTLAAAAYIGLGFCWDLTMVRMRALRACLALVTTSNPPLSLLKVRGSGKVCQD